MTKLNILLLIIETLAWFFISILIILGRYDIGLSLGATIIGFKLSLYLDAYFDKQLLKDNKLIKG